MPQQTKKTWKQLFVIPLFLFLMSCSLLLNAQIGKIIYGGQITGKITIPKQVLELTDFDIDQMQAYLKDNLKANRYAYPFEGDRTKIVDPANQGIGNMLVSPTITFAGSDDENYYIDYSVGETFRKAPVSVIGNPTYLDQFVNYSILIKPLDKELLKDDNFKGVFYFQSIFGNNFYGSGLGVAYLIPADAVFECYNFTLTRFFQPN